MNDIVEKLFLDENLVFIATINPDGSPQLTPVWGDFDNGYVQINTAEGRIKHKNVLNDPRVAVSVVDKDDPLKMTTISGKVIEILPDYDYNHADKLAKKYMNLEKYPFKRPGEKRITFLIKPEKIFVLPEIPMNHD